MTTAPAAALGGQADSWAAVTKVVSIGTLYSLQYTVQYAVYCFQCTQSVQCTSYGVQLTVYSVQRGSAQRLFPVSIGTQCSRPSSSRASLREQPHGPVATWPHGLMALQLPGLMASWPHGPVAPWPCSYLAPWPHGPVAT